MTEKKISIFKSFLIGLVIISVFAGITMGFEAIHLQFWPFGLFIMFHTMFEKNMNMTLMESAIGSFTGLTIGFSRVFFNLLLGEEAEMIGFGVVIIIMITCVLGKRLTQILNPCCMLFLTIAAIPVSEPTIMNYLSSLAGFALAAAIFIVYEQIKKAKGNSKTITDATAVKE